MKVGLLVQWHPDRPLSLTSRWGTSASALGGQVRYFSGIPWGPAASGLKDKWRKRSQPQPGVDAIRYPYFHSHDDSALRRFATYGTFAARSSLSYRDLAWADVVLVYCSPATVVAAAMLADRLVGVPYVMMVQDVWPDSIFATGFIDSGPLHRVAQTTMSGFVSAAYRRAAAVTALSPGMREMLISRGADPATTHVIYNWARQESRVPPRVRAVGEPLHVMYAGNLGPGQDLGNALRAMSLLPPASARLTLVGSGADEARLRRLSAELGLADSVTFRDPVSMDEMPDILAEADLHLVSLADQDVFRITIPSKLNSLMAMGLPVLAAAPGEVNQLVVSTGCGIAVEPGNPAALAAAISGAAALPPAALAAMGASGADTYYRDMALAVGTAKLDRILTDAAATRRSGARRRRQSSRPAT